MLFSIDIGFLVSLEEDFGYELSAVLLHLGDSAVGGHYVAHIRNDK